MQIIILRKLRREVAEFSVEDQAARLVHDEQGLQPHACRTPPSKMTTAGTLEVTIFRLIIHEMRTIFQIILNLFCRQTVVAASNEDSLLALKSTPTPRLYWITLR